MKTLKRVVLLLLMFALPQCGSQLVEFDTTDGGNSSRGGTGNVGRGGTAGIAGRSGGTAGIAGRSGGTAGGGTSGTAGRGGGTPLGGSAGEAGAGGDGGVGGDPGEGGVGGSGGVGGDLGLGGVGGTGGVGGVGGDPGEGGMGGESSGPSVILTNPPHLDVNVPINKTVTATFDETMIGTTIDFTLTGPGLTPVTGLVLYNPLTSVVSFDPALDLAPNTLFTATIAMEAENLAGETLVSDTVWTFRTGAQAAQIVIQPPVILGAASNFVILASARITNIPLSNIVGDVGLHPQPASNITGFNQPALCPEVLGEIYVVDATGPSCATMDANLLLNAKTDAGIAFTNARAAVRGTPQAISGNLNGLTFYPGLYESGSSLQISPAGMLYLDAQGDSNAVFIIRSAETITTEATSQVVLTKGAKASNIFWTAGTAVTLGVNSIMKGTLLAGTAITLQTGANLEGRALTQTAAAEAITLDRVTAKLPLP